MINWRFIGRPKRPFWDWFKSLFFRLLPLWGLFILQGKAQDRLTDPPVKGLTRYECPEDGGAICDQSEEVPTSLGSWDFPDPSCPQSAFILAYNGNNEASLQEILGGILQYEPKSKVHILRDPGTPVKDSSFLQFLQDNEGRVDFISLPPLSRAAGNQLLWTRDPLIMGQVNGRPAIIALNYEFDSGSRLDQTAACTLARKCQLPLYTTTQSIYNEKHLITKEEGNSLTSGGNFLSLPGKVVAVGKILTEGFVNTPELNENLFLKEQVNLLRDHGHTVVGVDVSFLLGGHVDEIFSMVRTNNKAPCDFALLAASPKLALDLLLDQVKKVPKELLAQPGRCREFDFKYIVEQKKYQVLGDMQTKFCLGNVPLEAFKNPEFLQEIRTVNIEGTEDLPSFSSIIEHNILKLKNQLIKRTGCKDPSVIPIPVLFSSMGLSILPNSVNGLSLAQGRAFLSPKTYFPPFDQAIKKKLADFGVELYQANDLIYHVNYGDIHCASNNLPGCRSPLP